MKASQIEKIRLWAATEYNAGYEFPEFKDGKWKSVAQFKLTHFTLAVEVKKP